jgi:uncharacterized membrane protein
VSYFEILLVVHILGAIIGFGPTFTFGFLGPLAGKLGGPPALGVLHSILTIQTKLVLPIATVVQPVTGVLLIVESGRDENFFEHEWLWISILLYVFAYYTSVFVSRPGLKRMIELAQSGEAQGAEFAALRSRAQKLGPIVGVSVLIIIILMITKPGAPESFF